MRDLINIIIGFVIYLLPFWALGLGYYLELKGWI
jgi:hypothetical protein